MSIAMYVIASPEHFQQLTRLMYSAEARLARSARPIRVGSLRPAIVLYDESHPLGDDIGAIQTADLSRKPDMLIIMGTSLKVHGLKKLAKDFARVVHSACSSSGASSPKKPFKVLFVNKTAPAAEWSDIIDYHISGETDRWSNQVIEDWKKMRPADWEIQQTLVSGKSTATGMFKSVKSAKPSKTSKPRQPLTERENVGPRLPQKSTVNEAKLGAPLSPTKRRKKASHYDDLESSPSKRRTTSEHAMPASERRMLFIEKTNQPAPSAINDVEKSKVDMSLCDLSMRDVKSGDMDVSILELSMIDVDAIVEEQPPIKPRTKARSKMPDTKRKPTARMVTRPKRTNTRTDADR
jgi:NAD-dependent histone deacetylase SIR2